MPSEEAFYEKLDLLGDYVSRIGDRILQESKPDLFSVTENEESGTLKLTGHICTTDNVIYYVAGHPDIEYFGIIYHLSLKENIAQSLDMDTAQGILERNGVTIENGDPRMIAASHLLSENIEQNQAFESRLRYEIFSSDCLLDVIHDSEDVFVGYALTTYIFPYEDDFNIRNFYDNIESVVGVGSRSEEIIRRGITIENKEDATDTMIKYNL